jgi:NADH-quinone oxidoreductase subunit L
LDPLQLVWLVPGLPLIGFLFQAFFGKAIVAKLGDAAGKKVLGFAAVLPVFAGFAITLILWANLPTNTETRAVVATLFDWLSINDIHPLKVPFEFLIDPLSIVMCMIVTGVGGLIHLYATGYMADDKDYPRFFTYFNLFIVFMLTLVLANNLVLMFVGWEGVGLCSYLLIGFWYKNVANAKAANKAFIVNRIGDWGFMLGIFLVFAVFNSVSFYPSGHNLDRSILMEAADRLTNNPGLPMVANPALWIPLLLFVGAMGKSAQGPLYLWLPDAMAGPTPVSALIHAATMVTAGVFMVCRLHIFFELSQIAMLVVACVGAFTAFFAATIAFGQFDIKRVLAYSTVSQLGYMFLACGVGAFGSGMFHVVTHSFFKALLFLGSGAVILAMSHEQDMRKYGNLSKYLPITYRTMFWGWLAIAGIPPLAGFWSKDEILSHTYASGFLHGQGMAVFLYSVGLITAVMTAGYMTRMMKMTFLQTDERWRKLPEPHHHELGPQHEPHEVGRAMTTPLIILALLSIVGGAALAIGPHLFETFTHPSIGLSLMKPTELPGGTEALLIGLSIAGAVIGLVLALRNYKTQPADQGLGVPVRGWRALAEKQWGYDGAMYRTFVTGGGNFATLVWRWIDAGIIDKVLVNGIAKLIETVGVLLRPFQSGFVRGYAFTMLIGVVAIIGWVFLKAVVR